MSTKTEDQELRRLAEVVVNKWADAMLNEITKSIVALHDYLRAHPEPPEEPIDIANLPGPSRWLHGYRQGAEDSRAELDAARAERDDLAARLEHEQEVAQALLDSANHHARVSDDLAKRLERAKEALKTIRLVAAECVTAQGGWDETPEKSTTNAYDIYNWANNALADVEKGG